MVQASGFSVSTQSVKVQGTSLASTAEAADASTLFYNPAGIAFLGNTPQLSGNAFIINADASYNASAAYPVAAPGVAPQPIAGKTSGNIGGTRLVPNFFYTRPINNKYSWGIGMFVPFGSSVEYDGNSVLRYNGNKTNITAIAFQPTLSIKANERHAFGIGLVAQHLEAELRQYSNFGASVPPIPGVTPGGNGSADGYADIKADDWGFGVALSWMGDINDRVRLGASYRSAIKHDLKGKAKWKFTSSPAFAVPAISNQIRTIGYAASENATTDLTTPSSLSLHGMYKANSKWDVFGDITWTGHSSVDEIKIKYENSKVVANAQTGGRTQADFTTLNPNWDDSYKIAAGAAYKYTPNTQLRFGVAFDKTPVPSNDFRLSTLPGNDRVWLSLGATTAIGKQTTLDFAYSYVDIQNSKANVNGYCGGAASGPRAVNCVSSRTAGTAKFENQAHILGLQLNYKF